MRSYNRWMSRVIQFRITGVGRDAQAQMQHRFAELAAARDWRDGVPWLAYPGSSGLLAQLFFEQARHDTTITAASPLAGAGFVRIVGDEADALAVLFILRDLSQLTGATVAVRDPDNPISKLRQVDMNRGNLASGAPLESILVRRAIYRRMADGSRMEMVPPRSRGSAFGRAVGDEGELVWSFIVHGIRVADVSFLGAEAEAMRIFRGLRALRSDERW